MLRHGDDVLVVTPRKEREATEHRLGRSRSAAGCAVARLEGADVSAQSTGSTLEGVGQRTSWWPSAPPLYCRRRRHRRRAEVRLGDLILVRWPRRGHQLGRGVIASVVQTPPAGPGRSWGRAGVAGARSPCVHDFSSVESGEAFPVAGVEDADLTCLRLRKPWTSFSGRCTSPRRGARPAVRSASNRTPPSRPGPASRTGRLSAVVACVWTRPVSPQGRGRARRGPRARVRAGHAAAGGRPPARGEGRPRDRGRRATQPRGRQAAEECRVLVEGSLRARAGPGGEQLVRRAAEAAARPSHGARAPVGVIVAGHPYA